MRGPHAGDGGSGGEFGFCPGKGRALGQSRARQRIAQHAVIRAAARCRVDIAASCASVQSSAPALRTLTATTTFGLPIEHHATERGSELNKLFGGH